MTKNQRSFELSMQVSGGRVMLGAVRDLAAHVATYAGGSALASAVADEVVTAAEAAIAASRGEATPVDVTFRSSPGCLDVFISGGRATALSAAPLSRGHGLSVDWVAGDGAPVCHIRQAFD